MKLFLFSLILTSFAFGSQDLDARLSFKNMVGIVLNSAEEPVHSDQVEAEIAAQIKDRMRFDFSESGYLALKESLKQVQIPQVDALQNIRMDNIKPGLGAISALGVKAAILGYIHRSLEGYQLYFYMVAVPSAEIMHKVEVSVDNSNALDSFSQSTKKALAELMKGIPFDATIISREGYRVILDRGMDLVRPGQQIAAYTIEDKDGTLLFEETGLIQITQVEPNLSFGRVTVEKRPKEVTTGNKIRLDNSRSQSIVGMPFKNEESVERSLASVPPPMLSGDSSGGVLTSEAEYNPQFEISKGKVGNVGIDLGVSSVGFATGASYQASTSSTAKTRTFNNNRIYPLTTVRGEIYLTSRVFFEGQYSYAVGRVDAYSPRGNNLTDKTQDQYQTTSGSMNAIRLLLGYRINLFAPNPGPVLYVKGGYARQAFSFNEEVVQTQFLDTSYGGLLLGGGVSIHPIDKLLTSFEVSTNVFPGVRVPEALPATGADYVAKQEYSGFEVTGVSSWEVAVKASYEITKDIDIALKGYMQNYGADFSSENNKKDKILINSVTENIKGFQAGLSYYF